MTNEEKDMEFALDNAWGEFKVRGEIVTPSAIETVQDAYKKVTDSMMRTYAMDLGGEKFVDAVDKILL